MEKPRVCIIYYPWVYTDIFQQLFRNSKQVTLIENYFHDLYPHIRRKISWESADIIILSLDSRNSPEIENLQQQMPKTWLVAFSPCGDYGLQRRPDEDHWEIVRPFGFEQLLQFVQTRGDVRSLADTDYCGTLDHATE